MSYELSKSQKKIARKVMDKGIENHYVIGLTSAEEIIKDWRNNSISIKDAYMKLVQSIEKIDEDIAFRYNNKGGSRWVDVMAGQLADGVITIDDLNEFDQEVRDTIIRFSELF